MKPKIKKVAAGLLREPWNLWIDDQRDPVDFLKVRQVEYDGHKFDSMTFPEFEVYIQRGFKAEDFVWCKTAWDARAEVEKRGVPKIDNDITVTLLRVDGTSSLHPYPQTLEEWQKLVGGLIEVVSRKGLVLIVNEEGLLQGLEPNLQATMAVGIPIVGNAILLSGASLARWNREGEAADDEGIDA